MFPSPQFPFRISSNLNRKVEGSVLDLPCVIQLEAGAPF